MGGPRSECERISAMRRRERGCAEAKWGREATAKPAPELPGIADFRPVGTPGAPFRWEYWLQTPRNSGPVACDSATEQWCAPRRRQQAGTLGCSPANSPGATGREPKIAARMIAQTRRTEIFYTGLF